MLVERLIWVAPLCKTDKEVETLLRGKYKECEIISYGDLWDIIHYLEIDNEKKTSLQPLRKTIEYPLKQDFKQQQTKTSTEYLHRSGVHVKFIQDLINPPHYALELLGSPEALKLLAANQNPKVI